MLGTPQKKRATRVRGPLLGQDPLLAERPYFLVLQCSLVFPAGARGIHRRLWELDRFADVHNREADRLLR